MRNIFQIFAFYIFSADELDSYMYQTVGHQGISTIAEAMELPLYRVTTQGKAMEKGRLYEKTENDEVEDLYDLLKTVKVLYGSVDYTMSVKSWHITVYDHYLHLLYTANICQLTDIKLYV